ncbi:MAG: nucleoside-diphosphate kinase [archaeon]
MEKTFSMIKPDAVGKNLIGEIIKRYESAGLQICAAKLINLPEVQVRELYKEHEGKEFYEGLVEFALSGPVVVMVVSGENAVAKLRKVIGATNPKNAEPGTIRGDLAKEQELPANMVHASDSPESAEREIAIFFNEDEIVK